VAEDPVRRKAYRFIVLVGIVSLFADVTYEGARSITGPFLAILGATGAVVGIVAGLGELLGYGLRLVSGYISDRTRRYWFITILGYGINLLAVPLLALVGRWQIAAALILTERIGKAIRTPARDAMLSHAAENVGRGWAFGLHEALDQIGAVTGPLIVAFVLSFGKNYHLAFAWLLVPALLSLASLTMARLQFPDPSDLEIPRVQPPQKNYPRAFWIYLAGAAMIAAGYADFPLIAFHLKRASLSSDRFIPLIYSVAMAVDAAAALVFGRWFDRKGMRVLIFSTMLSAAFAPLAFSNRITFAIGGMILWGIGMGVQESILRAAVSKMVVAEKRASAFGIFNAAYGLSWFAGSALMGFLYDKSLPLLILFSVTVQLLALGVFVVAFKPQRH